MKKCRERGKEEVRNLREQAQRRGCGISHFSNSRKIERGGGERKRKPRGKATLSQRGEGAGLGIDHGREMGILKEITHEEGSGGGKEREGGWGETKVKMNQRHREIRKGGEGRGPRPWQNIRGGRGGS